MADGEPRFRLLDTIRAYAAEQLEASGETDQIRARHRDWYVALVGRAAAELSGEDQRRWLDRLEIEHDDIRAVLDRAVAAPDPPVAIGLAFQMWRFWQKHGHLAEARRRFEAMDAMPWSRDDPRLRAQLLEALGGTYWWMGDVPRMSACYREALALWLEVGSDAEIANAYYNASFEYAVPDRTDGTMIETDPDGIGLGHLERSREIYHRIGDRRGEANARWGIGNYKYFRGQPGNGVEDFRAALDMFREVGDLTMEAWSLHMLGTGLLRNGDVVGAHERVAEAIRLFHTSGDAAGLTLTLDDMSAIAVVGGRSPTSGAPARSGPESHPGDGSRTRRLRRGHVRDRRASGRPDAHAARPAGRLREGGCGADARPGGRLRARRQRRRPAGAGVEGVASGHDDGAGPVRAGGRPVDRHADADDASHDPDPGLLMRTCANCGAEMDERKCKLICRCGYFLSCSDYY